MYYLTQNGYNLESHDIIRHVALCCRHFQLHQQFACWIELRIVISNFKIEVEKEKVEEVEGNILVFFELSHKVPNLFIVEPISMSIV